MTRNVTIPALLAAAFCTSPGVIAGAALPAEESAAPERRGVAAAVRPPHVRIDRGLETATIYMTGEKVQLPAEEIWRSVCGGAMTQAQLNAAIANHERIMAAENNPIVIDSGRRMAGININFNLAGSVPANAIPAFQTAEEFYEARFGDPITVTINVSFANLGGGVLGATSSNYLGTTYGIARPAFIADMDEDDTLHTSLPNTAQLPVRYNASSSTVTNENAVFFTRANYNAVIGNTGGTAGSMTYNTQFNWDWDPTNGVPGSAQSFVDVVIHEVGHALGFTSGVDFRNNDIEAMDILRFQRTDGSGDYNPDTLAEFGTTPRTVDFNNPNDDANSDLIIREHRMSDGNPWQASHFREQSPNLGIMDPAQANGQTFVARGYFTQADFDIFDFIGYDYPPCFAPLFINDPQDQDVCEGEDINLFAQAGELGAYQWYKDGSPLANGGNISGADTQFLTISNATSADNGTYSVELTADDDGCTGFSDSALVTVAGEPTIFTQPPATIDADEGDDVMIGVGTIPGFYDVQWRKDGSPLSNGGNISGATSETLTISNATPADSGTYDVVLTDTGAGCEATSTPSVVTVSPVGNPCFADCDGSGNLNVDDIDCFVAAFIGGDLGLADCNDDSTLNVDDIDCFVSAFLAGCP